MNIPFCTPCIVVPVLLVGYVIACMVSVEHGKNTPSPTRSADALQEQPQLITRRKLVNCTFAEPSPGRLTLECEEQP